MTMWTTKMEWSFPAVVERRFAAEIYPNVVVGELFALRLRPAKVRNEMKRAVRPFDEGMALRRAIRAGFTWPN